MKKCSMTMWPYTCKCTCLWSGCPKLCLLGVYSRCRCLIFSMCHISQNSNILVFYCPIMIRYLMFNLCFWFCSSITFEVVYQKHSCRLWNKAWFEYYNTIQDWVNIAKILSKPIINVRWIEYYLTIVYYMLLYKAYSFD